MGWSGRQWGEVLAAVLLAHAAVGCTEDASGGESQALEDSRAEQAAEPLEPEESASAREVLSCEDIRPGALGPGRSLLLPANAREADCGGGTSDGAGSLALLNSGPFGARVWNVVSRDGVDTGNTLLGGDIALALLPQRRGFQLLRIPPGGASLYAYSSEGEFLRNVELTGSGDEPFDVAADPRGGSLVARWAPREGGTQVLLFQLLDSTGVPRAEPVEVISAPLSESRSITAGVDTRGRVLLLWQEPGLQTWVGQWLTRSGRTLTPPFALPMSLSDAYVRRLSPLADGGLALQADGQWVLEFPSGEAEAHPAPDWLASHPGSSLALIRGRRAHVLIPPPTLVEGSGCQESLLFFASDGTACGELALPLGGGSCFGRQPGIGLDGTVIQQIDLGIPANNQCAWRWWPGLLR